MVNTMADLRHEITVRMRNAIHGREIDTMNTVTPRLPHMLGITPIGKCHDPNNEEMTLLDVNHPFWDEYERDLTTSGQVKEKIETAVHSLEEDGILRVTYPHGVEAEVLYVEVDEPETRDNTMETTCKNCGSEISTELNLLQDTGHYFINVPVSCSECDFSGVYETHLQRK